MSPEPENSYCVISWSSAGAVKEEEAEAPSDTKVGLTWRG